MKFGTGVHVFCLEVGVFYRSCFQSVSCKYLHWWKFSSRKKLHFYNYLTIQAKKRHSRRVMICIVRQLLNPMLELIWQFRNFKKSIKFLFCRPRQPLIRARVPPLMGRLPPSVHHLLRVPSQRQANPHQGPRRAAVTQRPLRSPMGKVGVTIDLIFSHLHGFPVEFTMLSFPSFLYLPGERQLRLTCDVINHTMTWHHD